MKRFFIFLLILLFTVWIGVEITTDPGYVLISRHKLAVEMPLWLASIGLIFAFIIVYFLIRTIRYVSILPKRWILWLEKRRLQKQATLEDQRLFTILYQKPLNYNEILINLPELEKKNWLLQEQICALKYDYYENLIKKTIYSNLANFEAQWQKLPRRFRKDPHFLNLFINALIYYQKTEKAEKLTRKLLNRQWFSTLIHTYGLIKTQHPEQQLITAEKWLKKHPNDPDLLLALGRFCKQLQLWGKAKDYLETSLIHASSNPEIYEELAALLEKLKKPEQALNYYKKALKNRMSNSNSYIINAPKKLGSDEK